MDKSAIQKFAVWARRELINGVTARAQRFGITTGNTGNDTDRIINGQVLTNEEMLQRKSLIQVVQERGLDSVIDEAAYTWFNRFIALRYMEINDYLPAHIRVFSNNAGQFKPEIIHHALDIDFPGLNQQYVIRYIERNETDNLYRALLLAQCNALNSLLPSLFESIEGWTALLLPDNLLQEGSILGRMISDIPEADWKEHVQIIGWLYQFYNTELKAQVEVLLQNKSEIRPDQIPVVTQLYTPDWIVRYLVENSIGRLAVERKLSYSGQQSSAASEKEIAESYGWKYYLPETEQKYTVSDVKKGKAFSGSLQNLRIIDPCMGSGHVLVYAFEILMAMYRAEGWTDNDAACSILENNLYGLDIDARAAQLAYFSLMMEARKYSRRILAKNITPNVFSIEDSGFITEEFIQQFCGKNSELQESIIRIRDTFLSANLYGSLLSCDLNDIQRVQKRAETILSGNREDLISISLREKVKDKLIPFLNRITILSGTYDIVCTNPPYMGIKKMPESIRVFLAEQYPNGKHDTAAAFMERCMELCKTGGLVSIITNDSWMHLSSYKDLRENLLSSGHFVNLAPVSPSEFDGVETAISVICREPYENYLTNVQQTLSEITWNDPHPVDLSLMKYLPGGQISCEVSEELLNAFASFSPVSQRYTLLCGLQTGDNKRFCRYWFEVPKQNIDSDSPDEESFLQSERRWVFYNKGGGFRRWYGLLMDVVDWKNGGQNLEEFKNAGGSVTFAGRDHYFKPGITWNLNTFGHLSLRYVPAGTIVGNGGPMCFPDDISMPLLLGFLNSKVAAKMVETINPSRNCPPGTLGTLPYANDETEKDTISRLVQENIQISKEDWDTLETSPDFKRNPLIAIRTEEKKMDQLIADKYKEWKNACDTRFQKIKSNEEELNRIYLRTYGLENEMVPDVDHKEIKVQKAEILRDIKALISYVIGCIFGRYSAAVDRLQFAGGNFDEYFKQPVSIPLQSDNKEPDMNHNFHQTSIGNGQWFVKTDGSRWIPNVTEIDDDNILPICDDEYFSDDIVGYFADFIKKVYGESTLEENLNFISEGLGGKGTSRDVLRNYFLKDFYTDHLKTYQKTPIYWLVDAGKKNSFKALIYIHRYEPNLMSRLRTDYVHVQQQRLEARIKQIEESLEIETIPSERKQLTDRLKLLREQEIELRRFEEKVHHLADQNISIDLNDGVKANYQKFADILAPIK